MHHPVCSKLLENLMAQTAGDRRRSSEAVRMGYAPECCPECKEYRLKSDGNTFTCDECGWNGAEAKNAAE
jgi:ribosomal protein L37AE/L43A